MVPKTAIIMTKGTPQPTMTGDAAVSAMLRGEKVTHRYFEKGEWVRMENGKVIFEDGATEYLDNFWAVRKSEAWQTDWSIFTPVPSPDSVKDMGEVTPPTELDFLKASNLELERIATIYKKQRDDGAARLEEVTSLLERASQVLGADYNFLIAGGFKNTAAVARSVKDDIDAALSRGATTEQSTEQ